MAVVDDKILARVERLLRLAAPSSNTTLQEREVAAVEAAKLIEEHDLVVTRREARRTRSARYEREASYPRKPSVTSEGEWILQTIHRHSHCSACNGLIAPGDVVWISLMRQMIVHNYTPCDFMAV